MIWIYHQSNQDNDDDNDDNDDSDGDFGKQALLFIGCSTLSFKTFLPNYIQKMI